MKPDQPDLFYPDAPGWRDPDTSRQAAKEFASAAASYRNKVFRLLSERACTVHEAAARLGAPVPSIQPRFSELLARNLIYDTGARRINRVSGHSAKVWRAREG